MNPRWRLRIVQSAWWNSKGRSITNEEPQGANSESFEYKDIANLGTKTFAAGKNKTELLNFVFKKTPQTQDRFNFLRFYSDTEATLPGSFEISIYELSKILREKVGLSQSSEEKDFVFTRFVEI